MHHVQRSSMVLLYISTELEVTELCSRERVKASSVINSVKELNSDDKTSVLYYVGIKRTAIMKAIMLHLLVVVLYIFPHCVCREYEDCINAGGEVPSYIANSQYTILPNGSLCCPLFAGNFCKDEKEMKDTKCVDAGLVYEPCHFCKTCAKRAGESCGGIHNEYGTCDHDKGLQCIPRNATMGTCYNATQHIGEACGGLHGGDGVCLPGLKCSIDEDRYLAGETSLGVCLNATTAPGVCYKNCAERNTSKVCGSDGRWYDNKCHLRKQNCIIPKDRQPQRIKYLKDNRTCEIACGDIKDTDTTPLSPNAKISYSNGVVDGSRATVECKEGYQLITGTANMTLQCINRNWKNVVKDKDSENEVFRDTWSVVCI